MLDLNKIYNIDCLTGMAQIADESIDMIFADLPYEVTANNEGVAAKNLNRDFIGMELDEKYFTIAKQRIEGV